MRNIEPIPVDSPLKGEWMVLNSHGTKVPSHGTDYLAQTYAFDLLQVNLNQKPLKFYKKSVLDYFLGKVHLSDCYCYGKPIYAPISGAVVEALDGYPERDPVQPIRDISIALKSQQTLAAEIVNSTIAKAMNQAFMGLSLIFIVGVIISLFIRDKED